ncbi:MAG: hypothetical protein K0R19_3281, partial [Bacillota bacterium]|nr:hypothetical protein [Bacillota bacterium]
MENCEIMEPCVFNELIADSIAVNLFHNLRSSAVSLVCK